MSTSPIEAIASEIERIGVGEHFDVAAVSQALLIGYIIGREPERLHDERHLRWIVQTLWHPPNRPAVGVVCGS